MSYLLRMRYIFTLFLMLSVARAELPNQMTFDVNVKESIVRVGDKRYRKIEYKSDVYYLKLLESEKSAGELLLECGAEGSLSSMENQVVVSTKITKRSSLFISGLKQTCGQTPATAKRVIVDPNIKVGFLLDDAPKDRLKNKMIYVTPLNPGVGFSGEF